MRQVQQLEARVTLNSAFRIYLVEPPANLVTSHVSFLCAVTDLQVYAIYKCFL